MQQNYDLYSIEGLKNEDFKDFQWPKCSPISIFKGRGF